MFESLSGRFEGIFTRLRGRGRLGPEEVDAALREIRVALLEADVELGVARQMVSRIREQCLGADLSASLSPAQQVVKIVHQELISALGGESLRITYSSKPPTVVLLAGLQGAGKTTAAGKLGLWFKQQGRNPLLVAADLQRPAAITQLEVLGRQAGVPVWSTGADHHSGDTPAAPGTNDPVAVAKGGLEEARRRGRDVLIVDTAGRHTLDDALMAEVANISEAVEPDYTFLVIDAMAGQEAVTVAREFHDRLALDGILLSKLDSDARGGAALSVKQVVGRPIAFASVGEKLSDLEAFHPDRMAGRILGMGDMLTLIEKAEANFDADVASKGAAALAEGQLTLEDFLEQLQQVKKMGPLQSLVGMLPGLPKELKDAEVDDREIARVEAIIRSMTPAERRDPRLIDGSRRSRIAKGSGLTTSDVNMLLKQFKEMQKMMRNVARIPGMGKAGKKGKGRKAKIGPNGAAPVPAGAADGRPEDLLAEMLKDTPRG
ncbi:MAG: signal recognition particle protein [Actinobacteria bacterium]|nr:signal recognition particle protein [Actinomycetota bacterium]